jgi:hypothetical protein
MNPDFPIVNVDVKPRANGQGFYGTAKLLGGASLLVFGPTEDEVVMRLLERLGDVLPPRRTA